MLGQAGVRRLWDLGPWATPCKPQGRLGSAKHRWANISSILILFLVI